MLHTCPENGWQVCPRCDAVRTDTRAANCSECGWHIASCAAMYRTRLPVAGWRLVLSGLLLAGVIAFVTPAIDWAAVRAGENEPTLFVVLIGAVLCFAVVRYSLARSAAPRVLFNQDGVTFDGTGLPREPIAWRDFETAEIVGKPAVLRLSASWDYVAAEIEPRDIGGMQAAQAIADAILSQRPRE